MKVYLKTVEGYFFNLFDMTCKRGKMIDWPQSNKLFNNKEIVQYENIFSTFILTV